MDNTTKPLFRDLLLTLANGNGNWRATPLTGFACLRGNLYNNGLLVVGRAVNGWASKWTADELRDQSKVGELVEELYPTTGTADCPLMWVSDSWGQNGNEYNTKKSAFWRVIRGVVSGLSEGHFDDCAWPSTIAWSNLYKVSPAAGRNPSEPLADAQLAQCKKILEEEIRWLNPSRILFLTGWGWAQWFLPDLQFAVDTNVESPIEASGIIFNKARVVVLPHPERKTGQPLVTAAVDYFQAQPGVAPVANTRG